jgi:hypothetical protein
MGNIKFFGFFQRNALGKNSQLIMQEALCEFYLAVRQLAEENEKNFIFFIIVR